VRTVFKTLKARGMHVLSMMRREWRVRELASTARHVGKHQLVSDLQRLGIVPGDVVFLHSSLKSLGYVDGGPRTVLEALWQAVGPTGTLIVPTYYSPGTILAACQQPDYLFDLRLHGTNLGALPSEFLRFPGVERSIHPTHSVSAVGRYARYVTESHHLAPSIFGAGSPWDRCIELDGKILGLGVTMGPVTFYHVLEDRLGDAFPLPVRMRETHTLKCRDLDGNLLRIQVVPLDPLYMNRRIDNRSRDDLRDYFWREFTRVHLLNTGRVGESTSWWIGARAFYDHLHQLLSEGITIYATAEELAKRPLN
jgi:aminoglycoside N3'-acetyltransferase